MCRYFDSENPIMIHTYPYCTYCWHFEGCTPLNGRILTHEPSMPLVCWDLCPYNFHFITLWAFSPHESTRLDIVPLLLQGFLQRFRSGSCGHRWNSYSPSWSDAKKNPLIIPLLVKFPVNHHCRMISSWIAFQKRAFSMIFCPFPSGMVLSPRRLLAPRLGYVRFRQSRLVRPVIIGTYWN